MFDLDGATSPTASNAPKIKPKRQRRRGRFTPLVLVLFIALAAYGIWKMASSLSATSSRGFSVVTVGQSKQIAYAEMGTPCTQGALVGVDSHQMLPGGTYGLWLNDNEWELVVFSPASTATGSRGTVFATFTANRTGTPNFCITGVKVNPFDARPWFLNHRQ